MDKSKTWADGIQGVSMYGCFRPVENTSQDDIAKADAINYAQEPYRSSLLRWGERQMQAYSDVQKSDEDIQKLAAEYAATLRPADEWNDCKRAGMWANGKKRDGRNSRVQTVQVKKLPNFVALPAYANPDDAGCDLVASHDEHIGIGEVRLIKTGIAVALPSGYEIQIRGRSSLGKIGVTIAQGIGTVDAGYRGEIMVSLINHGSDVFQVNRGDRIAQAVLAPVTTISWAEVEELPDSERGVGGFGSSGI